VTPTLSDTTPIPTAVPVAEMVPGAINIVVLGSDRRPDWSDWHTDVIQVVSVQPLVPAVTVLSIPRDLYVYIPEFGMSRVNFADMYGELGGYEGGGPALLQQTLLYNLGIPVDHYVRTDFDGLIGIVDALGGVDIPVHCRLEDHWPYPDENGEYPIKVLEPGMHHMDGETALWYARSRMTSSVFARERRQQQVLQSIWRQSRSLDLLPRIPELWDPLRSMVVTDMAFGDVVTLADVAFRLDGARCSCPTGRRSGRWWRRHWGQCRRGGCGARFRRSRCGTGRATPVGINWRPTASTARALSRSSVSPTGGTIPRRS